MVQVRPQSIAAKALAFAAAAVRSLNGSSPSSINSCKSSSFCSCRCPELEWFKSVLNQYQKRPEPLRLRSFLVPLTGLEPVRILLRGILSPLCLPIPPQRRADSKIYLPMIQYFLREVKRLLILLHLSCIDKKMNLADNKKKDFYKEALL